MKIKEVEAYWRFCMHFSTGVFDSKTNPTECGQRDLHACKILILVGSTPLAIALTKEFQFVPRKCFLKLLSLLSLHPINLDSKFRSKC